MLDGNFLEGMACQGGCIGGAGCLTHGEKNKAEVDKYGREALEKPISDLSLIHIFALRAMKIIFEYLPRAYDNGPNAVSYTHLDVYKRQLQECWQGLS